MRKLIFIAIIGLTTSLIYSQNTTPDYKLFIAKAEAYYEAKDYKNSAIEYQNAFNANEGKGFKDDRYNAACSFALSGEIEKAFYQLLYVAEHPNVKYNNISHITKDLDLQSLHKNILWEMLLNKIKANKEELEKDFDKPLVAMLESIFQEDQVYRQQLEETEKKFGRESKEVKALWKSMNDQDTVNLKKVEKILDEQGWLGPKVIGMQGNATLFLVVQHAPLKSQEKYLPMLRDAVSKGNANPGDLALLEDRVALGQGKKQVYGSQVSRDPKTGEYYVRPLIDPDNVDKRRAEVGLGKLQNYISNWGLTWNVEEYKKNLPEIEAKEKAKK